MNDFLLFLSAYPDIQVSFEVRQDIYGYNLFIKMRDMQFVVAQMINMQALLSYTDVSTRIEMLLKDMYAEIVRERGETQ